MILVRRVRKLGNFTMVDNEFIDDPCIDWAGQGLMLQLLRLPPNWVISLAHLSKVKHGSRRQATESALKNLREAGYVLRIDYRSKGRFQTEYVVFETKADREAWMSVNNVQDGQKFDYEPNFVYPDLSDPKDPGEPKERKPRKGAKTDEELQAEAAAKEVERQAKAVERERQRMLKAEEKEEKKRLEQQKREEDNAWRFKLFGSKERYESFNRWYYGFYVPNSSLENPVAFHMIVLKDLGAGGEKYKGLIYQFELEEKKVAKAAEQERLNAHAAKVAEQANTPQSDNQPVQEPTAAPQAIVVETLLSASDLEWFKSSELRGDYLKDCLSELQRLKDFPVMHRQAISKYRKAQQAEDYYANQQVPV